MAKIHSALAEAIEFAEQDWQALTPAGETMVQRWRGALTEMTADDWQPIETAPRMVTILLFAVTDVGPDGEIKNWKMATGFWHSGFVEHRDMSPWEWNGRQLAKYDVQPTHWRPLPAPPDTGG